MGGIDPIFAGPVIAIGVAAALRGRPPLIPWMVCGVLVCVIAAPFYWSTNGHFDPPLNSASALAAFFFALPTLATFGVERLWFSLGWTVGRPWITAVLSIPLGLIVYALSLFIAMMIGVNSGLLTP